MPECTWPGTNELMQDYHDNEWGKSSKGDDRYLFEMLSLEGAQAGLSWITILKKREAYKEAFHDFDIAACAALTDEDFERILTNYEIVRNKLKIKSVRTNAQALQRIQEEFGSFSDFLWSYVDHTPIVHTPKGNADVLTENELSKKLSKDLKKRGFTFVGPVIIYTYMQAVGMIDDHLVGCPAKTTE
ncbi:DNA-3-methyladenine glycosylase I [Chryseomicrobium sp. FSL W7-1435]|uniref:DNA-3-methyladenine glycosylase I n=1 Tax=Chryseomicrobium sp. FSL W7-1435 TaxID=2921704 RepID=UPI00315B3EDF